MRKHKTKVITDESQVPAGFKRISSLADSLPDQKKLSDAHTDGMIAAVKLMRSTEDRTGPVWVDAEAARRVLEGTDKPRANQKAACEPSQQLEALLCALSAMVTNQVTTLHAIERIADAVEKIAKHPLARLDDVGIVEDATEASWRDMNGEHN